MNVWCVIAYSMKQALTFDVESWKAAPPSNIDDAILDLAVSSSSSLLFKTCPWLSSSSCLEYKASCFFCRDDDDLTTLANGGENASFGDNNDEFCKRTTTRAEVLNLMVVIYLLQPLGIGGLGYSVFGFGKEHHRCSSWEHCLAVCLLPSLKWCLDDDDVSTASKVL